MSRDVRVVKIGGSLLDWPELRTCYGWWQNCQSPGINVLLAGGGKLADEIRSLDRRYDFGELRSHWMCVDLLAITAQVLGAIFVDYPLITTFAALRETLQTFASGDDIAEPATVIFSSMEFLRNFEPNLPGTPLPYDWNVTSDSIAARLAEVLRADELVLLKSTLFTDSIVDQHFATATKRLQKVRLVNLRDESFAESAFPARS